MRILATNPDRMGDLVLRQPLYAALADAGHALLLAVRRDLTPIARLVAPSAELVTFDGEPATVQRDEPSDDIDRVCRAASTFKADRLLIAPYQWTVFDERIAAALPGVKSAALTGHVYPGNPFDGVRNETTLHADLPIAAAETQPELEKNTAIAAALLGRDISLAPPRLRADDAQRQLAEDWLHRHGLAVGDYWLACVTSRLPEGHRNWPLGRWAALLQQWSRTYGRRFVLVGDPGESAAAERVCQLVDSGAAINATGDCATLDLLIGLTSHAAGYVGRDTGPLHLAAAMDQPVVAVFGGGTWPRFMPAATRGYVATRRLPCAGCGWVCRYTEQHCLTSVSVESVWAGVEALETGRSQELVVAALAPEPDLTARMEADAHARVRALATALGEARGTLERERAALAQQRRALAEESQAATCRQIAEHAQTRQRINAQEARVVDLEIELERRAAEQAVVARFLEHKIVAAADAHGQLALLERRDERRRDMIKHLQRDLDTEKTHAAALKAQLDEARAALTAAREATRNTERAHARTLARMQSLEHERARLRAELSHAHGQVAIEQQRIYDLQSSRWRRLGLKMGVAKRAAWEQNGSESS